MREIKFRAWDKEEKDMEYATLDELIMKKVDGEHIDGSYYFSTTSIIMQYTGLKDKNGKEIYEGNIVKVTCVGSYGKEEWTHQVKYNKELACFSPFSYYHSQKLIGETEKEKFEVIGNIYQNPELLKEGK